MTVEWHAQINQIFIGLRNSSIISLYDPNQSKGGILNCITRQEKRRPIEGRGYFTPQILNPVLYEDKKLIEMQANARPGQEIEQALMVPVVPAEAYDP